MSNIKIDFIKKNDDSIVFFIQGYDRSKSDLPFLKNYLIKNKKISLATIFYGLEKTSKTNYSTKEFIKNIKKELGAFLRHNNFNNYYIIGYSLGTAIAIEILSRKLFQCKKVIIISVFDDRKDLLKSRKRISQKENIAPIKSVKKIKKIPMLFIHGTADESIRLYRAKNVFSRCDKKYAKFVEIRGADHHFSDSTSQKFLIKEVDKFLP